VTGLLAFALLALAARADAAPNCTGAARRIQWPSPANPVWDFCFLTPMNSTSQTGNGSGLDIFDVHYNGHLVLERAHAPILNVLYAPGGCGCYRDWSDSEVRFSSDGVITTGPGGYAEPTTPPVTVCESGGSGGDVGSFRGVAAYKSTDLVLTTQFQAGWYRYTMRWGFAMDGTITASFGFAAVTASCVSYDHTHHNYWRLDFDIDGPANDTISQGIPGPIDPRDLGGVRPQRERKGNWSGLEDFVVWDSMKKHGYRIVPGDTNVPDAFAVADYWLLRYKSNEIDDAGQSGPACAIKIGSVLNNETIENQDVVVWIRGGSFHEGAELDHCGVVGFTLQPVGDWGQ
jgi:hypothetical protein